MEKRVVTGDVHDANRGRVNILLQAVAIQLYPSLQRNIEYEVSEDGRLEVNLNEVGGKFIRNIPQEVGEKEENDVEIVFYTNNEKTYLEGYWNSLPAYFPFHGVVNGSVYEFVRLLEGCDEDEYLQLDGMESPKDAEELYLVKNIETGRTSVKTLSEVNNSFESGTVRPVVPITG